MANREKKPFVIDSISQHSRMKEYQPVLDMHLSAYFSSPVVRRTLRQTGLLSPKNQVIQPGYNPRIPKIYLPPLSFIPVHPRQPDLSNLTKTTSADRLFEPISKDNDQGMTETNRKSGSVVSLKVKKAAGLRRLEARNKAERHSDRWQSKPAGLKPLSHEEYDELLGKYCEPVGKKQGAQSEGGGKGSQGGIELPVTDKNKDPAVHPQEPSTTLPPS